MPNMTRSALLFLSLLLACGAGDLSSETNDRVSTYNPSGAFGAFLAGRVVFRGLGHQQTHRLTPVRSSGRPLVRRAT